MKNKLKLYSSKDENSNRNKLLNLFKNTPVTDDQILGNLEYVEEKWNIF